MFFHLLCFPLLLLLTPLTPAASSRFRFPQTDSTVLPDPSPFLSPNLLSSPLPTNSFFQNFVLNNGNQPEYFHPYLINSSASALSISYPSLSSSAAAISQTFSPDITISALQNPDNNNNNNNNKKQHIVSAFNDLSITLDFPSTNLSLFLVRGSPYVTCKVTSPTALSISTVHSILQSSSIASDKKHIVKLDNGQTWIIYTSTPTTLRYNNPKKLTFDAFSGIVRFALVPGADPKHEAILDKSSSCYPVSGEARFIKPYTLKYKWEKNGCIGWGGLLMLAHPLHLKLLKGNVVVLNDFKYSSVDGDLVGVVADSWVLETKPINITWHSIGGLEQGSQSEIISSLRRDVALLNSAMVNNPSSYFYGKLAARVARLALIAEEVNCPDVIPKIRQFLIDVIEPWLDGTFTENGFMYESKWGGLVTRQGSTNSAADFGFGLYNDHHFHLGYFVYGISVLAKIDPDWGLKYKPQAYALVEDFINKGRVSNSSYPRLRCFDRYKLHSWAGGVTEFADGRNQESTSEAVNGYYAAALMGRAYGDDSLAATGSVLTALEIQATQMWWHVSEGNSTTRIYQQDFSVENKLVGVLWANKRDSALWFAPAESKEIRLGIQVLPVSPITEVLFNDGGFAKEVVEWTLPALAKEGVTDAWKGFVYSLQGIYDKAGALDKIRSLSGVDDGNSITNLLWWIHSRRN